MQDENLIALLTDEQHVQVKETCSISERMITANRESDEKAEMIEVNAVIAAIRDGFPLG